MKFNFKSVFNSFMCLTLLGMLFSTQPAQSVRADSSASPLATGSNLTWAKAMGGTGNDASWGIATDSNNNVYTMGYYTGTADFDPGAGIFNQTSAGDYDLFVSKLNSNGDFVWAKSFGGTAADDGASGVVLDSNGNLYITGSYTSTTIDFGGGALNNSGGYDVFVVKLDNNGNHVWSKSFGGLNTDQGDSIQVDTNGNVYVTGYFASPTIDFGGGSLNNSGDNDIFITKLDTNGNHVWSKAMGGTGSDQSWGIALDSSNNPYIAGSFSNTVDFDPGVGVLNLTSAGNEDAFVAKFDSNGNFTWAKGMGGTQSDVIASIALDSTDHVYTTGYYLGTSDFDPGAATANLTSVSAALDIFVSKLDSSGNYVWAKSMGGVDNDSGSYLKVDSNNNIVVTGVFQNTADFDPGADVFNMISAGAHDIFISKLNSSGNFVWAEQFGGTGDDSGNVITTDSNGNIAYTGSFQGIADFDPGAATANLTSAGTDDIFVSKINDPAPTVTSITRVSSSPTSNASVQFLVTFSESVTGVDAADFSLTATVIGASITSVSSDSGTTRTVTVNTGNGDGTLRLDIVNTPSIVDLASNALIGSYTSGEVYSVDKAPTILNITRVDASPTANASVQFLVTFSESVTGVDAADFSLTATVTGASITSVSSDSGATRTVTVNTGSGDGTLRLDIVNSPSIMDSSANVLAGPYTGGEVYAVNKTLTYQSTGAQDGSILESAETSSKGGTLNSKSTTFNLGDDVANKQYRAILSFNTGVTLPDNATVTKVTLKVKKSGVTGGGNPVTTFKGFMADIKKGAFGTSALAIGDFQAAASKTYGPFNTALSGGWYSISLISGKAYINKLGLTQIRLRFKLDDNNNFLANYIKFYSGNAGANSPQLVIQYYVP